MNLRILIIALSLLSSSAKAGLVHYNFEGVITFAGYSGEVSQNFMAAKAGQKVNAIYSIDDRSSFSGSTGTQLNILFDYAILNYSYYISGKLIISDSYRINRLQFAKGSVNGRPTDFIDFTLDGGRDNYNNDYGLNDFGEYVDSYLYMADSSATVFDYLRYAPKLPDLLEFERFDLGVFDVSGMSNKGGWFARHDISGIRSDTFVSSSVSAPMTSVLVIMGLALVSLRRHNQFK